MDENSQLNDPSVAVSLLHKVSIFGCFSAAEKESIFGRGRIEEYDQATNVLVEGEKSRGLYVILSGRVSVFKNNLLTGDMHRLTYLDGGEHFGELSLLEDSPRAATVVAESKVRLFHLSEAAFSSFMAENDLELQVNFFRSCVQHLVERFRRQNADYIEAQQILWQHALRIPGDKEATQPGAAFAGPDSEPSFNLEES